jgi:hypothetical protein
VISCYQFEENEQGYDGVNVICALFSKILMLKYKQSPECSSHGLFQFADLCRRYATVIVEKLGDWTRSGTKLVCSSSVKMQTRLNP